MKACRICLVTEAKFTQIKDERMASFLEKIFHNEGYTQALNANHFVCLECKTLLRKSFNFIQKALNAQKLLYGLIKNNETITSDLIQTLDRKGLESNSRLSYHNVTVDLEIKHCQDGPLRNDNVVLKKEVDNDDVDDPLNGNETEQSWNYSDFTDLSAFSNICKAEKNVFPSTSCHWLNFEGQEISQNIFPVFEQKIEVEILKTEVDDDVTGNNKKSHIHKNMKGQRNKSKKDTKSKPKMEKASEKSKQVETKDNTKNCLRYLGDNGKAKRMRRKLIKSEFCDEDYKPMMASYESDSSDTSYDEQGRPKKKVTDIRKFPMKCDHCDYIIPQKKEHYRHYLISHTAEQYPYSEAPRYVCSVCGVQKTQKNHLVEHEKTHGERKEKCKQCGKVFHNLKNLQKHVRIVHGVARFFCHFCNKGFKGRVDIVRHLRTHTGEKPYKCPICGTGFAHSGNVKIHMNSAHSFPNTTEDVPWRKGQKGQRRPRQKIETEVKYEMYLNDEDRLLLPPLPPLT